MSKVKLICILLILSFLVTACASPQPAAPAPAPAPAAEAAEEPATAEPAPEPEAEVDLDQVSSEDEKEIIFWNLWGGGDGAVLAEMIEEFNNTNPDGIRVISLTQDWGQYYTKLRTAFVGGQSPDLAMSHVTRILELQQNRMIMPIDAAFADAGIHVDFNNFTSGVIDNIRIGGSYYGVPVDNLTLTLMYNRSVLNSLGLLGADGRPAIGNDIHSFIHVLQSIEDSDYIPLQAGQRGFMTQLLWYTLYKQMGGGDFLAADLRSVTLDQDIAVRAAQYLQDLYNFTPPHVENNANLFAEGRTAFMFEGSWSVSHIAGLIEDDFGVMMFPQFFDQHRIWTDSHAFVLPVKAERSEQKTNYVLTFIEWFSENNWMWSRAGHLPANMASWEHPEFIANTHVNSYAEAGNHGVSFPSTQTVWLTFSAEFSEPFEMMINEGADPEATIDLMIRNLNTALTQ